MSRRARLILFLPVAVVFLLIFCIGAVALAPIGHYKGPYGDILNAVAVGERHSTDVVTAVNFDYRGFDTLGEESILFISVMGAGVLLRQRPDEIKERAEETESHRQAEPSSDAVRILTLALAAPTIVFGIYVVTHGQISPGGGFQGGIVLATVPLLVYLAEDFRGFQRIASRNVIEALEASGVAGYIVIGLIGYFAGSAFLQNVLPLGPVQATVYSAGIIPLINIATGLAVSAGFVLLLLAFLEETLEVRLKVRPKQ